MSATVQRKRKKTAREISERLGLSERTVRNYMAQPREHYERTAEERREIAGTMWEAGESWEAIAEAVGGSVWSARGLVRRWRLR